MIDYGTPMVQPRSGTASEAQQALKEQQTGGAIEYLRAAETWVGTHPAAALGLAVIAGAGVGWLIKRR